MKLIEEKVGNRLDLIGSGEDFLNITLLSYLGFLLGDKVP